MCELRDAAAPGAGAAAPCVVCLYSCRCRACFACLVLLLVAMNGSWAFRTARFSAACLNRMNPIDQKSCNTTKTHSCMWTANLNHPPCGILTIPAVVVATVVFAVAVVIIIVIPFVANCSSPPVDSSILPSFVLLVFCHTGSYRMGTHSDFVVFPTIPFQGPKVEDLKDRAELAFSRGNAIKCGARSAAPGSCSRGKIVRLSVFVLTRPRSESEFQFPSKMKGNVKRLRKDR